MKLKKIENVKNVYVVLSTLQYCKETDLQVFCSRDGGASKNASPQTDFKVCYPSGALPEPIEAIATQG